MVEVAIVLVMVSRLSGRLVEGSGRLVVVTAGRLVVCGNVLMSVVGGSNTVGRSEVVVDSGKGVSGIAGMG